MGKKKMDYEQMIKELKNNMPCKDTLTVGDIVLFTAPSVTAFGITKKIERDKLKRGEWWHVTFTVLSIPLTTITWIMRTAQMTGQESFTMDGEFRFFAALDINLAEKEKSEITKPKLSIVKKEIK